MSKASPAFLYVEDDPLSRKVIQILLTRELGYSNVAFIENSANFLEKMHALPAIPDVIFLDIQLRPFDGYKMLEMLRAEPLYQKVTIIAMTANVMSYDVENLQRAGFSGLIGKPVMKDVFPQLVAKILAGEPVWYVP